jgi:hypothetical protein
VDQIKIVNPDGEEIGRIILDGDRLTLAGCAKALEDAIVSDLGRPVTRATPRRWFELAYQLATPYAQMYPV